MKESIIYIIAQIIGFIAFIISLYAYHKKDKESILDCMIVSNILNIIHYIMLNATSGFITKALAITRDTFVLKKSKHKRLSSVYFLYIFVFIYLSLMYAIYDGIVSIFPFIASIYYLIGIWEADELRVKKVAMYSFIPWLIYNICVLSISGIISNIISILSTFIAIKSDKYENNFDIKL